MYHTGCTFMIRRHFLTQPMGGVVATIDLCRYGAPTAIRKALTRLCDDKICQRIIPGIYCASYGAPEGAILTPPPEEVAYALARNNNWRIVPEPHYARFILGIEKERPKELCFYSTGPHRKYSLGSGALWFIHSGAKFVIHMDAAPALITSALKDAPDPELLFSAASHLPQFDQSAIDTNKPYAPARIRPVFDRLREGIG